MPDLQFLFFFSKGLYMPDLQLLKWQALIVPEQWQCCELLEQSFGIFHIVNYLSLSLTLTPKLVLTISYSYSVQNSEDKKECVILFVQSHN